MNFFPRRRPHNNNVIPIRISIGKTSEGYEKEITEILRLKIK